MTQQKEATELFIKQAPQRSELGGTLSDTNFRRGLMDAYMEAFGASNAKAATLYNNAKKYCEANNPDLVVNLGRKKQSTSKPVAKASVQNKPRKKHKPNKKYKDNQAADSRQLWSAVQLSEENTVSEVHAFYDDASAKKFAGKKTNWTTMKGLPEIGQAVKV